MTCFCVLDHTGAAVGTPVVLGGGEPGVTPGAAGVEAWDLDFGRVSILTCMDVNFMELWHAAYALGAVSLTVMQSSANLQISHYFEYDGRLLDPCAGNRVLADADDHAQL
jgi:hypothetical protein